MNAENAMTNDSRNSLSQLWFYLRGTNNCLLFIFILSVVDGTYINIEIGSGWFVNMTDDGWDKLAETWFFFFFLLDWELSRTVLSEVFHCVE